MFHSGQCFIESKKQIKQSLINLMMVWSNQGSLTPPSRHSTPLLTASISSTLTENQLSLGLREKSTQSLHIIRVEMKDKLYELDYACLASANLSLNQQT